MADLTADMAEAFERAPVGLVVTLDRTFLTCNAMFEDMFSGFFSIDEDRVFSACRINDKSARVDLENCMRRGQAIAT